MKSIGLFLLGFFAGIVFLSTSIVLVEKYQDWKRARLEPVLVDMAGCGDNTLQGKK